jgi:uncharacterized Zn-binding protein involved in type VI secretion
MTNALTIFDPANVPDHIKTFNETHTNIGDKTSVDSLTYKGKIWTVAVSGTKTPLMKKNEDGDDEPRSTLPVVLLDYNKRRGRSYYSGGYVDDRPAVPDCWSPDGITPDPTSTALQSDKCATCPMAVKGSKTTEQGAQTTACSQFRMAAIALYRKWDMPPLRLRLAITSDYDAKGAKANEAKGWYAFQQLTDLLRARGVKHTASVVIRLKFDPAVAYPKVLFSPVGWTTEEEIEILAPLSESDEVKQLLSPTYTPNGGDGARKDQTPPAEEEPDEDGPIAQAPPAAKAPKAPKAKVAPAPAPAVEDEDAEAEPADETETEAVGDEEDVTGVVEEAESEEDDADTIAAAQAQEVLRKVQEKQAKKIADAQAAAAARKAAATEDDDEITVGPAVAPKTPAPKAAVAPAKATPKVAATVAPKTPAKAAGAIGAAPGKAPKATAAAPKPVSPAVAGMLEGWQDDD